MKMPDYYKGDENITCMDALRACVHGWNPDPLYAFWFCNAFKYLWRFRRKNGVEDLYKCEDYIDMLIDEIDKANIIKEP